MLFLEKEIELFQSITIVLYHWFSCQAPLVGHKCNGGYFSASGIFRGGAFGDVSLPNKWCLNFVSNGAKQGCM